MGKLVVRAAEGSQPIVSPSYCPTKCSLASDDTSGMTHTLSELY